MFLRATVVHFSAILDDWSVTNSQRFKIGAELFAKLNYRAPTVGLKKISNETAMRTLSKKSLLSTSSLLQLSSNKTANSSYAGFSFSVVREVQVSKQRILQFFSLSLVTLHFDFARREKWVKWNEGEIFTKLCLKIQLREKLEPP